ncbi:hypothetical protein IIY68_01015 [Candidatus Saccharibacteria bacterium]|nr:hypothetical protein [Candidatus Saccharibacteria bacterium]
MAYNEKSRENLKPFTGPNDPRRQNGRKKGQINRKTAIRNLLNQEIDPRFLINDKARERLKELKGKTCLEAILYTLTNQALGENTRASDIILRELRHIEREDPPSVPFRRDIQISVVNSDEEIKRLERLQKSLEDRYGENYEDLLAR